MAVSSFGSQSAASVYSFEVSKPAVAALSIPDGLYKVSTDIPAEWGFYISESGTKLTDGFLYKKVSPATLTFESNTIATLENPTYTLAQTSFAVSNSNIYGIAYGAGVYLASGSSGYSSPFVSISTDAITWSTAPISGLNYTAYAVAYLNNQFLIGTTNGFIFTSPDGITWTSRGQYAGGNMAYDIAYGNGIYVAVFGGGYISTSTDSITWTSRTANFSTSDIKAVVFGGDRFVATGSHVAGNTLATTSTDGITWTTRSTGFSAGGYTSLSSITYGYSASTAANVWVVGSTSYLNFSTDLTTWTVTTPSAVSGKTVNKLSYSDGRFYALANETVAHSADPASWSWTAASTGITTGTVLAIAHGPLGKIVSYSNNYFVSVSKNGWTGLNAPNNWGFYGGVYGNGKYLLVGIAGIGSVTSTLATWTQIQPLNWGTYAYTATYGNGKFVVGGQSGNISISTDGTTWTPQTSIFPADVESLGFGNGIFLAGGASGTLKTSTDAITWTTRTQPYGNSVRGFAYGNGIFVAVWSAGYVTTSTDGITWTARGQKNGGNAFNGIAFGNGRFVTVIDNNAQNMWATVDGINWTSYSSGVTGSLYAITYRAGLFVAVGASGVMTISTNGTAWGSTSSGVGSTTMRTVVAGPGVFVIAGDSNTGYYHRTFSSISPVKYLILESKGAPTVL